MDYIFFYWLVENQVLINQFRILHLLVRELNELWLWFVDFRICGVVDPTVYGDIPIIENNHFIDGRNNIPF